MNFKTRFERKENTPDVCETDIVGVVELTEDQYIRFRNNMLDDYMFIADYAEQLYDDGQRKHALLVLGKGDDDGSSFARRVPPMPDTPPICRKHDESLKTRFSV